MDALETKGRVGLHRWPRESCCTRGDSRFASSRQLVCDKSKDGNPMTLILIPFLNQPPAARFFCCASRPGGNEGRRKPYQSFSDINTRKSGVIRISHFARIFWRLSTVWLVKVNSNDAPAAIA